MRKKERKVKLTPRVVFEDNFLLVLDKPAGLVVNRIQTVKRPTLQDWLEKKLKIDWKSKILSDFDQRAGIVHRLDKETSGLLVVAKTRAAFDNLQSQFKERKVKKTYSALVHGLVKPKEGIIEAPISRNPFNRKKFGVFLGGRSAQTKYRVKKNYVLGAKSYTLLLLFPITGRTHQIRVHLKYLGYPIVGDEKYGGRKTARQDRIWCPRQFLHATELIFIHPKTGKRIDFSSPLPVELKKALR